MLLPLAVFLLRSVRAQLIYLMALLVWSSAALYEFRYPGVFVDANVTPALYTLRAVYINGPIFTLLLMWLYYIPWRSLSLSRSRKTIFEPSALAE
jgi:hypothetical protein